MESIESKLNQFKAAFQELALTFINSDFVKQIVDMGTALLKFANTDLGQTIIKIVAFSATLKTLSLVVGKLGLIESFTKLGKAIKSAFTFTEVTTTSVGLKALAKNAKVAIGAMSGFSKVALAIGAIYGLAKVFMYIAEKPARDLEKLKTQVAETEKKYSDVVDEAEQLKKKQEDLAKSGKELADSFTGSTIFNFSDF